MSSNSSQSATEEESIQWECVRLGLGWCSIGMLIVVTASLLVLVGVYASLRAAVVVNEHQPARLPGPNGRTFSVERPFLLPLESNVSKWGAVASQLGAGTELAGGFLLVIGLALCCAGPIRVPGRWLPGLALTLLSLIGYEVVVSIPLEMRFDGIGVIYSIHEYDVVMMVASRRAAIAFVAAIFFFVLLGYLYTLAVVRRSMSLAKEIVKFVGAVAGLVMVDTLILSFLSSLNTGKSSSSLYTDSSLWVIILGVVGPCYVGLAWYCRILYFAWRLIPRMPNARRENVAPLGGFPPINAEIVLPIPPSSSVPPN